MQKFFEFLSMGIVTPFAYLVYAVVVIALTFLLGLPLAIGIYFIQMFILCQPMILNVINVER
jgi:hypothetical protein